MVAMPLSASPLRQKLDGICHGRQCHVRDILIWHTDGTMANAAVHPGWWIDLLTTEPLEFASLRSWGGTVAELVDRVFVEDANYFIQANI